MTNNPDEPAIVSGPAVTAIGWIPFHSLRGNHLPTAYARHHHRYALRMMLRTGNRPEPPYRFTGRREYRNFIDTRNFRAALCMSNVRLICHSDGRHADIEAEMEDFIGYTPMQAKRRGGRFSYDLAWHEKGIGELKTVVQKRQNSATIRRTIEFRVGDLGNLGSMLLTGMGLPYAWMSIAYTLSRNGQAHVDFQGSLIPSQSHYINWRRDHRHSMLTLNANQISAFLRAGANFTAPGQTHHVW